MLRVRTTSGRDGITVNRRTTNFVLSIGCALLLTSSVLSYADWPSFRGDSARSGVVSGLEMDRLEVSWSAELGGSVDSSPAVADGVVYVGNSLGYVHALSAEDGQDLWSFKTGGAVVSSPAIAQGLAIVGSVDGFLYALDAVTGEQAWRYRTRGPVLSSPAVIGDTVIFGSMDGRIYALSLTDGALRWRTEAGPGVQGGPTISGDLVLHGDDGARMRALRIDDGSVVWEREGRGRVVAAPVARGDIAVFGLMGPSALRPPRHDYLVALEVQTGEQVWALNEAYSVLGSPVIGRERVFFVTVEGYLSRTVARAAQLTDGELLWDRTLGGVVDSSPVLIGQDSEQEGEESAGVLGFGCHDGRFYLLQAATGQVADITPLAPKIYSSPAVSDGRVYIGANDGHLYCLQ